MHISLYVFTPLLYMHVCNKVTFLLGIGSEYMPLSAHCVAALQLLSGWLCCIWTMRRLSKNLLSQWEMHLLSLILYLFHSLHTRIPSEMVQEEILGGTRTTFMVMSLQL